MWNSESHTVNRNEDARSMKRALPYKGGTRISPLVEKVYASLHVGLMFTLSVKKVFLTTVLNLFENIFCIRWQSTFQMFSDKSRVWRFLSRSESYKRTRNKFVESKMVSVKLQSGPFKSRIYVHW